MRVLVTGGAGFLGRAAAARLHAAGHVVVLIDRSAPKLASVWPGSDPRIELVGGVDLTAPGVRVPPLGTVDALIHTVGGFAYGSFLDTGPAELESLFRLNVLSAQAAIAAVLPGMIERGSGTIVAIASEAALAGGAGVGAYAASKAALLRLLESLAHEVGPKGVTVASVLPGTLDTPPNRAAMPGASFVPPGDVAEVLSLLCSPAGRSLHGTAVRVPGAPRPSGA